LPIFWRVVTYPSSPCCCSVAVRSWAPSSVLLALTPPGHSRWRSVAHDERGLGRKWPAPLDWELPLERVVVGDGLLDADGVATPPVTPMASADRMDRTSSSVSADTGDRWLPDDPVESVRATVAVCDMQAVPSCCRSGYRCCCIGCILSLLSRNGCGGSCCGRFGSLREFAFPTQGLGLALYQHLPSVLARDTAGKARFASTAVCAGLDALEAFASPRPVAARAHVPATGDRRPLPGGPSRLPVSDALRSGAPELPFAMGAALVPAVGFFDGRVRLEGRGQRRVVAFHHGARSVDECLADIPEHLCRLVANTAQRLEHGRVRSWD